MSTWEAIDQTVWPRDFLPKHGSAMNKPLKLRIKSFHYNTTIKGTTSTAGLREHAADLIRKIYNDREDDMAASIRPIIFIGHSLGGMLIKRVSRSIPTYPILLNTSVLAHRYFEALRLTVGNDKGTVEYRYRSLWQASRGIVSKPTLRISPVSIGYICTWIDTPDVFFNTTFRLGK